MYAQLISLYRQLLTEVVMDEGRDSQVAGNFLDCLVHAQ